MTTSFFFFFLPSYSNHQSDHVVCDPQKLFPSHLAILWPSLTWRASTPILCMVKGGHVQIHHAGQNAPWAADQEERGLEIALPLARKERKPQP